MTHFVCSFIQLYMYSVVTNVHIVPSFYCRFPCTLPPFFCVINFGTEPTRSHKYYHCSRSCFWQCHCRKEVGKTNRKWKYCSSWKGPRGYFGEKDKSCCETQVSITFGLGVHSTQSARNDSWEIVVNLDWTFSAGQGYVALSRVMPAKEGLFIEMNDPTTLQKKIYADP